MSQLTQQIAGAYIGAQVEITKYSGDIIVGAIKSVSNDRIWITHKPKQGYPHLTQDWAPYDQCRLILTPLSAISDEDSFEVARMIGKRISEDVEREDCFDFAGFQYYLIELFETGSDVRDITVDKAIKAIDYLRSRNYDLGYMGIRSLIDAGIAISSTDKTDSNVQP